MKKITKILCVSLIALFLSSGVLGDWAGTFIVSVKEGTCDCDDLQNWSGIVSASTTIENDNSAWQGYTNYTFNLAAPNSGHAYAYVSVSNYTDPPMTCGGDDTYYWTSPPSPAVVNLEVYTD